MWPRNGKKDKDKGIPQYARETEELVLNVDSYTGPGKVLLYKYDRVLVNPDRHQELLHHYEFKTEVLVVLSLVASYLFENRWNLPKFDNSLLPNPLFLMDIPVSDQV